MTTTAKATKTARPLRAVVYVRLSRWRGDEDPSTSPERQRETCEAYAKAHGWEVVDVVEDLDVSGSERGLRLDRPGLLRIRERYAEIDVMISARLDRVARSVADFTALAEEAREHGVDLVCVKEGLDLSTPGGRFVATILAAFAQLEAETIRERTLAGKEKSRELGRWQGGTVPVGYRVEGRRLVVDETEAEALREAAAALLAGRSKRQTVRDLGARIPSRRGDWGARSLLRILTGDHAEEILGAETAYLVRRLVEDAPRVDQIGRTPTRLLTGLLRCATCGGPMYATSTGGKGAPTVRYRCHAGTVKTTCPKPTAIVCGPVDAWIEAAYLDTFGDVDEVRAVRVADERVARLAELATERDRLAGSLAVLRGAERRAAFDRLESVEAEIETAEEATGFGSVFQSTGRTYGEAWAAEDIPGRRALLAAWIGSDGITVGPGVRGVNGFQRARLVDVGRLFDEGPEREDDPERVAAWPEDSAYAG